MNHIIVVRYFKPGDEAQCKEIIKEGTMSTVHPMFFAGLTRELTYQVMILFSALMFIFFGFPFLFCIGSIPSVIIAMYVCIYSAHTFKVLELQQDVNNIPRVYMSSDFTGFWVAEVYEPCILISPTRDIKYTFMNDKELKDMALDLMSYRRKIVGTIAITKQRNEENIAWLRRMAVKHQYRRKGIATALLNEAIQFCKEKGYSSVELVTTECHDAARELYLKRGFELKQLYHKSILGTVVTIPMYELTYNIKINKTILDA